MKKKFKANSDHAKSNFYWAFNCIMAKIGRSASHNVMAQLLGSKYLPTILYGTEACFPTNNIAKCLDYVIICAFSKIFSCNNPKVIVYCKFAFGFNNMSDIITTCRERFLSGLTSFYNLRCCYHLPLQVFNL